MMEPKSRWHMHRMGMLDFWYYNEQEFYFDHGHMLLRGSNGSGKSVTLQSFLPLLLDGNKSSERLDTFGTRSRRMETYLKRTATGTTASVICIWNSNGKRARSIRPSAWDCMPEEENHWTPGILSSKISAGSVSISG